MRVNLTYDTLEKVAGMADCAWPLISLGDKVSSHGSGRIIFSMQDPDDVHLARGLLERISKALRSRPFLRAKEIEDSIPGWSAKQKDLLDDLVTHFPYYQWLDREERIFWKMPVNLQGQGNRVLSLCYRLFSFANTLRLSDICEGIERGLKRGLRADAAALYTPSELVLSEMLLQTKLFKIKNNRVTRAEGVTFHRKNKEDSIILRAAKGMANIVNFTDICNNAVREGLTMGQARTYVTQHGPFLLPVRRGFYRVLVDPNEIDLARPPASIPTPVDENGSTLEAPPLQEVFFEVDPRALTIGKARFEDSTTTNRHWVVCKESGEELGQCKIQGNTISEIKETLEKLNASNGDLIQISLHEDKGKAIILLISDEN
jgi:hypothetical protein